MQGLTMNNSWITRIKLIITKYIDDEKASDKYVISLIKNKWKFKDYPIKTWKLQPERDGTVRYMAGIINWRIMMSSGDTRKEALTKLELEFQKYADNHVVLPRPGAPERLKIQWAPTSQIDKYRDIANDFFDKVMSDYLKTLYLSDESRLSAYEPPSAEEAKKQREETIRRTFVIYCVDITNLYDGPVYKVFESIKNKKDFTIILQ
jgi:hypothetical protein